jgi:hypothetical protein
MLAADLIKKCKNEDSFISGSPRRNEKGES